MIKLKMHVLQPLDLRVTNALRHRYPRTTTFFIAVDRIGSVINLVLFVAVIVGWLYLADQQAMAAWLAISTFAVAVVFNPLLKLLFHRDRPYVKWYAHAFGYSYPSGHTSGAVVIFGVLMFLIPLAGWPLFPSLALQAGCVAIIAIIGVSRIYLGVHYASDVLAGLLEGLAWVWLTYPIFLTFYY